jgi:hypothetical protein
LNMPDFILYREFLPTEARNTGRPILVFASA